MRRARDERTAIKAGAMVDRSDAETLAVAVDWTL